MALANCTALGLIIIKFIAYLSTGSLAILASLADSSLDLLMSFINMLSIRYAFKPSDADHRFGHGAIEDIASLFQSVVMSLSAVYVIRQTILDFVQGTTKNINSTGIYIMGFSLVATLLLIWVLKYVAKRANSLILKTESLHYTSDVLTNGSILISLILAKKFDLLILDQLLAIAISLYMLWCSFEVFISAFDNLMGKELPKNITRQVIYVIEQEPRVKSYGAIRTRSIGSRKLIHVELRFAPQMTIAETHQISDEIENKIKKCLDNADVIIHQEPEKVAVMPERKKNF